MEYQIGDFSRIVGLSADTIKHYERQNIVEPSRRGENGYLELLRERRDHPIP